MNKAPFLALSACILVAACGQEAVEPAAELEAQVSDIEALADEYLAAIMERFPAMGTQLGIEGARHDRLYDNSLEALADWQQREDGWLARLGYALRGAVGQLGCRFAVYKRIIQSKNIVDKK